MEVQNPIVNFSLFTNRYDSSVTNHQELAWSEFADVMCAGHKTTDNKDVTLFGPWDFKTDEEQFDPRLTKDNDVYLIDGKPVVGRLATNVKGASMICLDYDGTMSISYAKNKFAEFTHVGYTSFSHRSKEKHGADCFRVVLPLAEYVTAEEIVEYRDSIYKWSEGADVTSLSIARCFYIPACAPDRRVFAETWKSDGDLFDVKSFDKRPLYVESPLAALMADEVKDDDRRWLIDNLKTVYIGQEPIWYKVAIAMYCNGFSYRDFVEVTVGGMMRQKSERDCEKKWKGVERKVGRNGHSIGIGFLYNILKERGIRKPNGGGIKKALHEKMMGRR